MKPPSLQKVKLSDIILNKDTQPRAQIDEHVVNEYRLDMISGAIFPPLVVFGDGGGKFYLADGWHRYSAAISVDPSAETDCAVFDGTVDDAILYSCKANADHGKRRSDGDKKRAIRKLIKHPVWSKNSTRWILKECGLDASGWWKTFTEKERKSISAGPLGPAEMRQGMDGKFYPASNTPTTAPEPPPQIPLYFTEPNENVELEEISDPVQSDTQPEPEPEAPLKDDPMLDIELYTCPVSELVHKLRPDSIDAIITDPPYPKEYIHTYKELAEMASVILKPGGILVAMCGHNYIGRLIADMSQHLNYHWLGCYYMPTGQHASLPVYSVSVYWKPLLIFSKGKWPKAKVFKDVFINDQADKKYHEWGQGITGFERIISAFTFPNETVLDPFVGGGTTAIAAKNTGRYFIGSDISADEISKTISRIKEG